MSKRDWLLVLVGGLFLALVNYPLLQIFNNDRLIYGLSPLALYLFVIWIGAIVMLFLFAQRMPSE